MPSIHLAGASKYKYVLCLGLRRDLLIWVNVTIAACFNGAIAYRNCSIKAPD